MDNRPENKLNELFEVAQKRHVSAPPFFEAKVLHAMNTRNKSYLSRITSTLNIWKSLALLSTSLCFVMAFFVFNQNKAQFEVSTQKPYMVRVELDQVDYSEIREAEIMLPNDVQFYSNSMPEIASQRSLVLEWENGINQAYLPFVIRGDHAGVKEIKIRFYNKESNTVYEKTVRVKFIKEDITSQKGVS